MRHRLQWFIHLQAHGLRKGDEHPDYTPHGAWHTFSTLLYPCMEYDVEGPRPRKRPKRTWREVVREDCQARKLNKEDAIDRCKWRKVIKDVRWSGWVWVSECFFWYRPTRVVLDKGPLNGCVCVYYTHTALGREMSTPPTLLMGYGTLYCTLLYLRSW